MGVYQTFFQIFFYIIFHLIYSLDGYKLTDFANRCARERSAALIRASGAGARMVTYYGVMLWDHLTHNGRLIACACFVLLNDNEEA